MKSQHKIEYTEVGFFITSKGNKYPLYSTRGSEYISPIGIHSEINDVDTIVINQDIATVSFIGLNIKKLIFNATVKYIYCSGNNLTELIIPQGCKYLRCQRNNLTKLELPTTIEILSCDIDAPINLLDYNNIEYFEFH